MYVVVGALKAHGVAVTLRDECENAIEIDVPTIQTAVGITVKVSASGQNGGTIAFQGDTPLVVAAKCAQIQADPAGFGLNPRPPASGEVRGGLGGPLRPAFLDGPELRLD
jgi:hypothetical protein